MLHVGHLPCLYIPSCRDGAHVLDATMTQAYSGSSKHAQT